ncbi:MAG: tetratricopeptide repeat protein [Burkholderiaceae bacterium]|nr:tetratricopeptide repeat protein [Burkholderiaceae bacterium]
MAGRGVPKNEHEALVWHRKAAEQGHAAAQNNAGTMYAAGEGAPKDEQQAVQWFRKAADQGHAHAQTNLARRYLDGKGSPKDLERGYFWLLLASAQGHAAAQRHRDEVAPLLSSGQRDKARAAARNWKANPTQNAVPPGFAASSSVGRR